MEAIPDGSPRLIVVDGDPFFVGHESSHKGADRLHELAATQLALKLQDDHPAVDDDAAKFARVFQHAGPPHNLVGAGYAVIITGA